MNSITKTTPAASVILPVYNAGEYLRHAIESVLSQTFTNFELLLLNDGSTDSSLELMETYAKKDPRCKIYSWQNKGLVHTLNEGIRLAQTEIIFRMDADDICISTRFEKQMEYLSLHSECVAVGSKVLLIDVDDCPIREFSTKMMHEEIDNDHLDGNGGSICHPASAIRKSALNLIGCYREQYEHAEDLDLFLRLAEIGRLANLPDVLLQYRQHITSIGYTKRAEQLASNIKAVSDARLRRGIQTRVNLSTSEKKAVSLAPTISDIHSKWAWWALYAGNLKTARKYAFKAIKCNPFKIKNIKLLACIMRGY